MTGVAAEGTALDDRYHFVVNASIMASPNAFQYAVDQIHKLNNLGILKAVEVLFIFVPIAFHAVVGVMIWLEGSQSLATYRYCGNIRYTFQRWTGIIAVACNGEKMKDDGAD